MMDGGRGRGHIQRQRQRLSESLSVEPIRTRSCLADWLVEQWAFGHIPATQMQIVASLTVRDHTTADGIPHSPGLLPRLASIGSGGRSPQHGHDNLSKLVKSEISQYPKPTSFPCTYLNLKRVNVFTEKTLEAHTQHRQSL